MSEERKKYLKKMRKEKVLVLGTQILILITFLGLWEFLADNNIIDSFITSSPSRILNTFANFSANNLLEHTKVTLYETLVRIWNWDIIRTCDSYNSMVVKNHC